MTVGSTEKSVAFYRDALGLLLIAAWKNELENARGAYIEIDQRGLLTECDIQRIMQEAFGPCLDRPER